MFLTIPDTVLQHALARTNESSGTIYGRLLDDDDVVQVVGIDPQDGQPLGQWVLTESLDPSYIPADCHDSLLLLICPAPHPSIAAYRLIQDDESTSPAYHLIESNVVRINADFTSRIRGLFEVDSLAQKRVVVVGLGTGGSVVAAQLARCGVGHLCLIDYDRLEVHNITRHVCGLRDIGRFKTYAMRDHLLNISPVIEVTTLEIDVLERGDLLAEAITDADLVVAATDNEQSKIAINRVCWPLGIPAVYAAAYNRAFGGDIFLALPPDGPCYDCFQVVVTEFFGPPPAATSDFSLGYADPERMADLIAEPGLGMDTGMIALIMTRVALMALLRHSATTLLPLPTNWVLFGNRAEWVFEAPLEAIFVDVPRQHECPTCNYPAYVEHHLHMTPEEAAQAADAIIQSVPTLESVTSQPPTNPTNQPILEII